VVCAPAVHDAVEGALMTEHEILKQLVRQLLNDLPERRDWLDPVLEQGLRYHVNATTPRNNYAAHLERTKTGQKTGPLRGVSHYKLIGGDHENS